jgi:hypothetical protein
MKNHLLIFSFLSLLCPAVFAQTDNSIDNGNMAAAAVTATPGPAPKEKEKITGSFEMNYLRHYIWRGISFGNDNVAQPLLEINYKGFTLGLAQNFNYKPKAVSKEFYTRNAIFDEQDIELRYSKKWGRFSSESSALAYFYFYQPGSPNTAELYNHTAYNFYKGFSVFTENSVDIASYPGALYSKTGVLFEHKFKKDWGVECNAYAGIGNTKFNSIYFAVGKGGVDLAGMTVDISKELGNFFIGLSLEKNTYTNPFVKQSTLLKGTDNFKIAGGINF